MTFVFFETADFIPDNIVVHLIQFHFNPCQSTVHHQDCFHRLSADDPDMKIFCAFFDIGKMFQSFFRSTNDFRTASRAILLL